MGKAIKLELQLNQTHPQRRDDLNRHYEHDYFLPSEIVPFYQHGLNWRKAIKIYEGQSKIEMTDTSPQAHMVLDD